MCADVACLAVCTRVGLDRQPQRTHIAIWTCDLENRGFDGRPSAMTQTTDGYLWVVDASGLRRFDGVHFVPWMPPPGKQLKAAEIVRALAARDGGLWIGTLRGLSQLDPPGPDQLSRRSSQALFGGGGRNPLVLTSWKYG
jgi:hypothetical protein